MVYGNNLYHIYVLSLIQATLQTIFPDFRTVQRHREVLKFACCLSSQPDLLIEFICSRLADYCDTDIWINIHHYVGWNDYSFLEEIKRNLHGRATVNPLCNRDVSFLAARDIRNETVFFHQEHTLA